MNFLSVAGDTLSFLPDDSSDTTVPCTLNLQLFAQLILGPVTALKWLLQPDLVNNALFQINAELLRPSHCSICV